MIFCASPRSSTPVQALLLTVPNGNAFSELAPHWLGEKAEKLAVPPGGRMQELASASSSDPMRTSPKPPANQIHASSIWSVTLVVLALELDARADLEAVVEHGAADEMDLGVAEHAVFGLVVARLLGDVLRQAVVVIQHHHVGGAEEAADRELDRGFGRGRRRGAKAGADQGRRAQQSPFHAAIPPDWARADSAPPQI